MAEGRTSCDGAAFDVAAGSYDSQFSDQTAGRWLRQSVWSRLDPLVHSGMHVLDLGCGTGEDALWLASKGCHVTAADGSAAMLAIVEQKRTQSPFGDRIRTMMLDLNALDRLSPRYEHVFDLIVSNFGAINCVDDLDALAHTLGAWIRPGGAIALTFMGRFCAWEFVYYAARLNAKATRRWSGRAKANVSGRAMNVRYWSMRELKHALPSSLRIMAVYGIGALLPPSYLFHLVDRWPSLFTRLARWERAISATWPASRAADHMLVILKPGQAAASARSRR